MRLRRFVVRPLLAVALLGMLLVTANCGTQRLSIEDAALVASTPVAVSTPAPAPVTSAVDASVNILPTPVAVNPPRLVAWGPAPTVAAGAVAAPAIAGEAALLMDETSGRILYAKSPNDRLSPASLTKIMTALLAVERGHLDELVDVRVDSRTMRGSTVMGLVPGEQLTLEDLLYGMMLPSGNDAALAIGMHVSGTAEEFVVLMNKRAGELGLVNTRFANPHGLDGAGGNYSSAYDLAVLTREAMRHEQFRTIANTTYRVVKGSIATYSLGTLNPLYGRIAGVDGVKTGYTRNARQTLVGSVTRDGHRVIVVVLRSSDRASDGVSLLNWAFAAHEWPAPTTVAAEGAPAPGS